METIIIPSHCNKPPKPHHCEQTVYLKKENFLSEFDSSVQQSVVHSNLNVYSKEEVQELITQAINSIKELLVVPDPTWITSGPVQSTVGYLEESTSVPATMTLQQICDLIFYGNVANLEVPKYVSLGNNFQITVQMYRDVDTLQYINVFQNGKLIKTIRPSEFINGSISFTSTMKVEETIVSATFIFKDGTSYTLEQEIISKSEIIPDPKPDTIQGFVGTFPENYSSITTDYLNQLIASDSINNEFFEYTQNTKTVTKEYNFTDSQSKKLVIIVPKECSDLQNIITSSQSFGTDSFDVTNIDLIFNGEVVNYKMYIYKQPLLRLNSKIVYKFK